VIGDLHVIRPLGAGGFGDVYLARDRRLGRRVAIKIARHGTADRDAVVREASSAARLSHPNVVTVFEIGEHDGLPYIVMEYVPGRTLRDHLASGPCAVDDAMRIGRDVSRAIAAAHHEDVIHLDLAPANVLLASDGRARVVDFGLARIGGAGAAPSGTPSYMAPEQWRGETVGPPADVWALGAILVHLVTGAPPVSAARDVLRERIAGTAPLMLDPALDRAPPELAAVIRRCLDKDPGARPHAGAVADTLDGIIGRLRPGGVASPFRGLVAFDEASAVGFYGRDDVVAQILALLEDEPVIAVVGPSGVGKSSVVRAGVAARLRERGWLAVVARPGRSPLAAIATAIDDAATGAAVATATGGEVGTATPFVTGSVARWSSAGPLLGIDLADVATARGRRLAMIVDQLEELETVTDPGLRDAAAVAIAAAADDPAGPVRVVVTLRDDFLGRTAARMGAAGLGHVFVLAPPGPAALRDIIEQPVRDAGYRFDDSAIVDAMIADVAGQPGALALVQSAGVALWERRDVERRTITRDAYTVVGGVAGAFAGHAQAVLDGCTPAEAAALRAILLRLVTPEATRRSLARLELLDGLPAIAAGVLDRAIAVRLVVTRGDGELELVHEAIATRWKTLATWLDESRGDRAFLGELDAAVERWRRRDRDPATLWSGSALADARRIVTRAQIAPSADVIAFVDAGSRRERRAIWRRRVFAGGIAIAAAAAITVVTLQRQSARRNALLATRRSVIADLEASWGALGDDRVLEARALLRSAVDAAPIADLDGALGDDASELWWRLGVDRRDWSIEHSVHVDAIAWSADEREIVIGGYDYSVHSRDAATAALVELGEHADIVLAAAATRGLVVTGGADGAVERWDARATIARHDDAIVALAVSGDHDVAAADASGRVSAWTTGGNELWRIELRGAVGDLAWSTSNHIAAIDARGDVHVRFADGRDATPCACAASQIAFAGDDLVVGTNDGEVLRLAGGAPADEPIARAHAAIGALATMPDRILFAAGDELHELRGGEDRVIGRATATIRAITPSSDGERVAVLSGDRTVGIWRLGGGEAPPDRGFAGAVRAVGLTGGAAVVIAGGDRGRLATFDGRTGATIRVIDTGQGTVCVLGVVGGGPDRDRVAITGGEDGTVRRWWLPNLAGGAVIGSHGAAVTALAIAPDGSIVATGSRDRSIAVRRVDGSVIAVLDAGAEVHELAFGGERLFSLTADRRVSRWTIREAGASAADVVHVGRHGTTGLAVSTDGTIVVVIGESPQTVIDLRAGSRRDLDTGPARLYNGALSPDARRLFVSGVKRAAFLDLDGGRSIDLGAHRWEIMAMAFSADGTTIATAGEDGLAGLWNAADGRFAWGDNALVENEMTRGQPWRVHEVVHALPTTRVQVGSVTFTGHTDGSVVARGRNGRSLLAFHLHGAIAELVVDGDDVVATTVTGDRAHVAVGRLVARGCVLVRDIHAAIPVSFEDGAVERATASRCR
jgi:WD40 repeat protein